jgi:D-sedoheptulose 7-phosphate isomerase
VIGNPEKNQTALLLGFACSRPLSYETIIPTPMSYFEKYSTTLFDRLRSVAVTDKKGAVLGVQKALDSWRRMTGAAQRGGKVHYFIGNGASATMASHMALDCSKNAGIPALAFNDPAALTALGNDLGFERTFSEPLGWHAKRGDVLVAISSSGRSPNILAGISEARKIGCRVVTLTGMGADNPARRAGDLNFYVPGKTYGCVECLHQIILHCWLDQCMGLKEWE